MDLIEFVSRPVNYLATAGDYAVKKIAANPSGGRKVLQIAVKIFAAVDLYRLGKVQERKIIDVMKESTDLIQFYNSYKNLMYWVNIFSKNSLDTDLLKQSIENSLSASYRDSTQQDQQKTIANEVFKEVMSVEKYHSKGEVRDAIRVSLSNHGYSNARQINILAGQVMIEQKARPITQSLYMFCFTIADLGSNILSLQKWHILELSQLAATIGSQSRVFMFFIELGADTVLGGIAIAGLVLTVGEASYQAIIHGIELYKAVSEEDKKNASKELRKALLHFVAAGVELTAASLPLVFALNPLTVVGLAIFAKGTGVIFIVMQP